MIVMVIVPTLKSVLAAGQRSTAVFIPHLMLTHYVKQLSKKTQSRLPTTQALGCQNSTKCVGCYRNTDYHYAATGIADGANHLHSKRGVFTTKPIAL